MGDVALRRCGATSGILKSRGYLNIVILGVFLICLNSAFFDSRGWRSTAIEHFQHQVGEAAERRIEKARAAQPALQENALAVREGLEAEFAVIGADAGRPDAAEGQIFGSEMKQGAVNGGAARDGAAEHVVALAGVSAEIIERQRARPAVF